jgi:preprotein translocase subunit SecY
LSSFSGIDGNSSDWVLTLNSYFGRGQPLYLALYISLIVFFAFFYTAIVFNPDETADNLKRNGGYVPGIRPGPPTSDYLDFVLTRLTAIGATYLAAVCILPEILISKILYTILSWWYQFTYCSNSFYGYSSSSSVSFNCSQIFWLN